MLRLLLGWQLLIVCTAMLIPRESFFSTNSIASPDLSPDGQFVGYITSDSNNVKNVFTMNIADKRTRQVTFENTNVQGFYWTGVEDVIIFGRDTNGDENLMLFKMNISEYALDHEATVICNNTKAQSQVMAIDRNGIYVLVKSNDVNPMFHNVYKFNLITDELSLIFSNSRFKIIMADNDLRIRLVAEMDQDGSWIYYRASSNSNSLPLTSEDSNWEEYMRTEKSVILGFDKTNTHVYLLSNENTDLRSLVVAAINDSSQNEVLYTAVNGEIEGYFVHPKDCSILALVEKYHSPVFVFVNEMIADDLEFIIKRNTAEPLSIIRMSQDLQTWLFTYDSPERPWQILVYHRRERTIEPLLNMNPQLVDLQLAKQIGFEFFARDGLRIQAYLSLPPEAPLKAPADVSEEDMHLSELGMIPTTPQKMIVHVHGGPELRDGYGYDSTNAFLANRGYATLRVNFRGSTGFGKNYQKAGYGEWSRKMHTDLLDAVEFTITKGIANRSAIAIMGASYGGYATLVGLTFTPDTFACGVDVVGPSNLVTLSKSTPAYWEAYRRHLDKMLGGDSATEEGRKELLARSPLTFADRVKKPLLIMQGANDPRVKQQEADQFVAALNSHSIPVTYVLYTDEGHGITRTPNVLAEFGLVEKFLHECLGGEYEPFTPGQYNESAIVKSDGFA